jgi:cysteinyl-tRNA synthetase
MTELKIYNTLTKQKEAFKPLNPPAVNIYVCGPTVYDFLHIGNFRGPVFFNLVRNYLELIGYKVKFALNFTDVDDKIIKKANELKIGSSEVSEKYIAEYKKDFQLLGLRAHDYNPKVTDSMDAIQSMVNKLIENNTAYVQDGDVLYSIEKFKEYGKLSGRNTEELIAGARVEIDEKKKNPLDFALWKAAKPGEPSWASPWGQGRPGWHIECSAMIEKIFGEQIDIHGGGSDLIFPHHENEIAQTEGCTHKPFVKYWIHWQMLNFSGQKMSKSLGNIISLRDFFEKFHL